MVFSKPAGVRITALMPLHSCDVLVVKFLVDCCAFLAEVVISRQLGCEAIPVFRNRIQSHEVVPSVFWPLSLESVPHLPGGHPAKPRKVIGSVEPRGVVFKERVAVVVPR